MLIRALQGVMLTHYNILSVVAGQLAAINQVATRYGEKFNKDDVMLSYLPLAHIFDRWVWLICGDSVLCYRSPKTRCQMGISAVFCAECSAYVSKSVIVHARSQDLCRAKAQLHCVVVAGRLRRCSCAMEPALDTGVARLRASRMTCM